MQKSRKDIKPRKNKPQQAKGEFFNYAVIGGILISFSALYISSITPTYGYYMLGDDAMISMRYAYNLAHGSGLVWNAGEYVQGFTNLGFTLLMAAVHLLYLPLKYNALIIQLLNLVILLLIILFLYKKGGWIPALLAALNGSLFYWGVLGFESSLQALCVLAAFYSRRNMLLWLALAFFIRADGIVFFLLGTAVVMYTRDKEQFRGLIYGSLLVIGVFLFQKLYYGDFLPNTYYLKSDGQNGFEYLRIFLFGEYFHLPLFAAAAAYIIYKRDIRSMIFIFGWMAYLLYIGEDCFPQGRFFIPIIPLLCLGFGDFCKEFSKRYVLIIPLSALMAYHIYARCFNEVKDDEWKEYIEIVNVLKKYPDDILIAINPAGVIPYFLPEYKFHDMLGKNDKYIARLPKKEGMTGHNKWDYDYSFSLNPDVVITGWHFRGYTEESARRSLMEGSEYSFNPALYLHENFKRNYRYVAGNTRLVYEKNN